MTDAKRTARTVHNGWKRCLRVSQSATSAEDYALVYGFDIAYVILDTLQRLLGRDVALEAYIDSCTLLNVVAKNGNTAEHHIQIDILALEEGYRRAELSQVGGIPWKTNDSNELAKELLSKRSTLWKLMVATKMELEPVGWAT